MTTDTDALRADLVQMLMHDRQSALQGGNPGAAVMASSHVVNLMMQRIAEQAKDITPLAELRHVVVYQRLCPMCQERGPLTASPPEPEPVSLPPEHSASEWDDVDEPAPTPALTPDAAEKAAILARVPKVKPVRRNTVGGLV